jgi:subtilisin family serine protease
MVARRDKRRLAQQGQIFDSVVVDGATEFHGVAQSLAECFAPCRPIAKLTNGLDDVLIVPGLLNVRKGTAIDELLSKGTSEFKSAPKITAELIPNHSDTNREVNQYRLVGAEPGHLASLAATTVRVVSELLRLDQREAKLNSIAPVYAFAAAQHMFPTDDPEAAESIAVPVGDAGKGVSIKVIDTGLEPKWAWATTAPTITGESEDYTNPGSRFLPRAAGHGTFIAGVIRQVAPAAEVEVLRTVNTHGFIDELALARNIREMVKAPPDILVICSGGYAISLGSFGTQKDPTLDWLYPLELLNAFEYYLANTKDTIIVMSAGNNDSIDPCFPAAFTVTLNQPDRLVSVGALDSGGWRALFSNYGDPTGKTSGGPWVSASTLGVRIRGPFVPGDEDPIYEPDLQPESWGADAFAQWSGTSFSAPAVAAQIASEMSAQRSAGQTVNARQAWITVRNASKPCREAECGVHVLVDGLASG